MKDIIYGILAICLAIIGPFSFLIRITMGGSFDTIPYVIIIFLGGLMGLCISIFSLRKHKSPKALFVVGIIISAIPILVIVLIGLFIIIIGSAGGFS